MSPIKGTAGLHISGEIRQQQVHHLFKNNSYPFKRLSLGFY